MGPDGAPIAAVTRADVYRHHPDCLKTDLFSTSKAASGAVGRPRLGEFDVVSTIGASRTIPGRRRLYFYAISMHATGNTTMAAATTQPSSHFNSVPGQHQRPQRRHASHSKSSARIKQPMLHAAPSRSPAHSQPCFTTLHKHAQHLAYSQPAHQRPPRHQCPHSAANKQPIRAHNHPFPEAQTLRLTLRLTLAAMT